MQVGGTPDAEECSANWLRLQDFVIEFPSEEDRKIYQYVRRFYSQLSAPPDFSLVKEHFEKQDDIETVARLDEISKSQVHIRTNYLAIVRAEQERQQVKAFVMHCRNAATVAEHGYNLDKPVNGKKVIRGVSDAVSFFYDKMSDFSRVEAGEKLEGVASEDAEEVIEEYEHVSTMNKFANRNLFGLEPVDSACRGHRSGEFWVHCAHPGELKCVAGDAMVFDHATGRRRSIKELFDSGDLPTVTAIYREGQRNKLIPARASHLVENGIRPIFSLELESGRRTSATSNHPFLTTVGWKNLGDIVPGDYVAVPRYIKVSDPVSDFTDAEVKAVGYMIGDGYLGKRLTLTASNDDIRHDFMQCLKSMGMRQGFHGQGPSFQEEFPKGRAPGVRVTRSKGGDKHSNVSPLQELLEALGAIGKVAAQKRIPDEFFGLPEDQVCLFLGALWSTDGTIHVGDHDRSDRLCQDRRNDVKYYSTSEALCRDVQSILLRIGVNSSVTKIVTKYDGEPYDYFTTRVIGASSKRKFLEKVRIVGKESARESALSRLRDWDDEKYPTTIIPDKSKFQTAGGYWKHASTVKRRETVSGHVLRNFAAPDNRISEHMDGDIRWERVKSITHRGDEMTYDLSVPEHHSFVVDDMVSHNTTLALNYLYNNCYVYEKNLFYCILEMPYKQLRRQLYVIHSANGKFVTEWHREDLKAGRPNPYVGIDYRKVRDGELDPLEKERFKKVAQDFKATCKGKAYIWRPATTDVRVLDIQNKAEVFHSKYGCDGIVLDHMGLIQPKQRTTSTTDKMNDVVTASRMMALSFARGRTVPVLGLLHINRQGKAMADKNEGRYNFSAISYANATEQMADVVSYTYLNDDLRREGKFYLGCMKNRDNPIFEQMVGKILWASKRMRAIESGLLIMDKDRIQAGANMMSDLTMDGMMKDAVRRVA
jgi:intein/homing endonuclease